MGPSFLVSSVCPLWWSSIRLDILSWPQSNQQVHSAQTLCLHNLPCLPWKDGVLASALLGLHPSFQPPHLCEVFFGSHASSWVGTPPGAPGRKDQEEVVIATLPRCDPKLEVGVGCWIWLRHG